MASIKPSSDLKTLLRHSHARVCRIALALCGNRKSAEAVVEKVLRQSGTIARRWETDADAERWFMHYTVLLSRACKSSADDDALLSVTTDADLIAATNAVRQLPMQQREAFLLHHGESMDLHRMATAMDCSSAAAANHLVGAVKALKESCPAGISDFISRLPNLLRQLVPPDDALDQQMQSIIATQRRRRWIRRTVVWLLNLIIIAVIAWLIWWIWRRVEIV